LSLFALSLIFLTSLFSTTAPALGVRDAGCGQKRAGESGGNRNPF